MRLNELAIRGELDGYGLTYKQIDDVISSACKLAAVRAIPSELDNADLWEDALAAQDVDPLIDEQPSTDSITVEAEVADGLVEATYTREEAEEILIAETRRRQNAGASKTEKAVELIKNEGYTDSEAFEKVGISSPTTKAKVRKQL